MGYAFAVFIHFENTMAHPEFPFVGCLAKGGVEASCNPTPNQAFLKITYIYYEL
jgi:hypothetical protein